MTSHPSPENRAPIEPGQDSKSRDEKIRKGVQQLKLASLGWNFVTAPLVGGALGYGADWLIGTYPGGMIVGLALGFISAFVDLIRNVR